MKNYLFLSFHFRLIDEWKENVKVIDRSKTISYSPSCSESKVVTVPTLSLSHIRANINMYEYNLFSNIVLHFWIFVFTIKYKKKVQISLSFFSSIFRILTSKIFTLPFKKSIFRYKFGTDRSMEEREKLWRQNSGVFSLRHESSLWRK